MNETQWQACTDPQEMLDVLRRGGKLGDRQLRLFATACCRLVWPLLTDERSRRAVEAAEAFAETGKGARELKRAAAAAVTAALDTTGRLEGLAAQAAAHAASAGAADWHPKRAWAEAALALEGRQLQEGGAGPEELEWWDELTSGSGRAAGAPGTDADAVVARVLRCVFGSPARSPAKRKFPAQVVKLARACAEDAVHAVLADALDELGEAAAAAHCREPGHARGCHVTEWVLGRG
jgi:hypothetical protein